MTHTGAAFAAEWVSIGRACQMLGVNPATLRQWTTIGKLHVYRTPGGHRRFSTAELASFSQAPDLKSRSAAAEAIVAQLRARYRGVAHSPAAHQSWLPSLDADARARFHQLGEELLDRLAEYLSTESPRHRRRVLLRAEEIARSYARVAAEVGLETAQAVEAYLLFRRPLLDVLARSLSAYPEVGGRIMRDAERFMDAVLTGVTGLASADDSRGRAFSPHPNLPSPPLLPSGEGGGGLRERSS